MEKIEKLELKHLCGYLPYGLKWKFFGAGIYTMCGITNEKIFVEEGHWLTWNIDFESEQALFPLLLPLSALTEPFKDGSVPIVELAKIASNESDWFYSIENNCAEKNICADTFYLFDFSVNDKHFSYEMWSEDECLVSNKHFNVFDVIEYLYSNYFDIYGLIPAGLAIDKRTLNKTQ